MNVYLYFDTGSDSLLLRKDKAGQYILNYKIPNKSNRVTLVIETKNAARQSKSISLNEEFLDVQFFPESGELVNGLMNRIGFKVLDYEGKGIKVTGQVFNDQNNIVAAFESNKLGMGIFSLLATSNSHYYAVLKRFSEKNNFTHPQENQAKKYTLPKVISRGSLLSVAKMNEKIRLIVFSNYLKTDSLTIESSCRGIAYYKIKGKLQNGKLDFSLSNKRFPEGIIVFTLKRGNKTLAERLYFNERPEARLKIELSTDKKNYKSQEKTRLKIEINNNNEDSLSQFNLSLLAVNQLQWKTMKTSHKDILSYFLLDSELKGNIENPSFYFTNSNKDRSRDIDALMLTQGWRKYNYRNPPRNSLIFRPERGLSLSGTVSAAFSKKKKKKGVELTLMTFGKNKGIYSQQTDSLGRFKFHLNDAYGKRLPALLQSANKSGKNRNYTISLNKQKDPTITYASEKKIEKPDSVVYAVVKKQQERKKIEESYKLSAGVTALDEVHLEGYKMTPNRKKVMEEYGKPDVIIKGKDIQEKEKKWSYGLYSVLLFEFPDDIRITRKGHLMVPRGDPMPTDKGSYLHAAIIGYEPTLVVVDGEPVDEFNMDLIPSIPPSEVISVELIRYAKNFFSLYTDVYPQASPMSVPMTGSVIAIYTEGGNGIFGVEKPDGILKTSLPVFSQHKEFYAPKHDNPDEKKETEPDLRSLIYWKPQIAVDSTGNFSTSFYNADSPGEIKVIVEGISESGKIGYRQMVYKVKK